MRTHTFPSPYPTWPLHAVMQDDDRFDDFDLDDEDDEDFIDCMMGPDGFCGKAGSEECEFDCPVMREHRARFATAMQKGGDPA